MSRREEARLINVLPGLEENSGRNHGIEQAKLHRFEGDVNGDSALAAADTPKQTRGRSTGVKLSIEDQSNTIHDQCALSPTFIYCSCGVHRYRVPRTSIVRDLESARLVIYAMTRVK